MLRAKTEPYPRPQCRAGLPGVRSPLRRVEVRPPSQCCPGPQMVRTRTSGLGHLPPQGQHRSSHGSWGAHLRAVGAGGPSWISSEDRQAQGGPPGQGPAAGEQEGGVSRLTPQLPVFLTMEANEGQDPAVGSLCSWRRACGRGLLRSLAEGEPPGHGFAHRIQGLGCTDLAHGHGPRVPSSPSLTSCLWSLRLTCGRSLG